MKYAGPMIMVSSEMLDDLRAARPAMDAVKREFNECITDLVLGRPRFGPPAPRPPVVEERCDHCGALLDEDW